MGRKATVRGRAYLRLKDDLYGPLCSYRDYHGMRGLQEAAYRALLEPSGWAEHLEAYRRSARDGGHVAPVPPDETPRRGLMAAGPRGNTVP